jgi:UTP--glucose-1-phosphate uridylyltransferase
VEPAVRKAVITAAGLGTRFLPATKAQPKEMLPLVDKPAIQYVVEEATGAGLTDLLIVTARGKRSLEDHFDRSFELEHHLETSGKADLLEEVRAIAALADIHYVRQKEPRGLGHAVSVARGHVGDEAFAILLGDDIISGSWLLEAMLAAHGETGASVLALKEVAPEEISSYGCAEVDELGPAGGPGRLVRVKSIVEKPPAAEAPSNLAVIGRYVLSAGIWPALERTGPGRGGEIQLTDGIANLMQSEAVYGYVFESGRYDVGNKLDYLKATVEIALERPDLGPGLREFLAEVLSRPEGRP